MKSHAYVCRVWKRLCCFLFFKVSINHLFDNLESGKRNYCLEKKHEKSLEFWIQESVRALSEWQINLSKLEGKGDEQGNSINEMVHSFDFFCVHAPLNITGWWYHVDSCTEQPLFLFWAKLHLFTISWMPFLGFPSFSPTQFNKTITHHHCEVAFNMVFNYS